MCIFGVARAELPGTSEPDFASTKHQEFEPAYMRALFDYGYARGGSANVRHKTPPILSGADGASPR
jgi:hypothetical protein